MKAVKFNENTEALLLVEKGDRIITLNPLQSAILFEESEEEDGKSKITSVFPENIETMESIPFSVTLAACVRVFLDDPDWVQEAHRRIEENDKNKA